MKKQFKLSTLILMSVCLILPGCSKNKTTASPPDSAPKYKKTGLHKIPDAVPKVEPLSRIGNRYGKSGKSNTYVAKKKRYTVLSSSRNYKARGVASWYGTRFHGRKTSNGERYNMYAMTAAHPTLPLPTYVKVTNLDNKKVVIVKVNDRGPFRKNRLIDLSYTAATKLGIVQRGTGRVEVQSVDPRDHGGKIPRGVILPNGTNTPALTETTVLAKKETAKAPVEARAPKKRPLLVASQEPTQKEPSQKTPLTRKQAPSKTISPASKDLPVVATAKALTEALTPTPPSKITSNKATSKATPTAISKLKKVYLQLSDTFTQRPKAEALVKKIEKLSKLPTSILQLGNPKSPSYQVRIGPVGDHDEAIKLTQKLAGAKLSTVVVTLKP